MLRRIQISASAELAELNPRYSTRRQDLGMLMRREQKETLVAMLPPLVKNNLPGDGKPT